MKTNFTKIAAAIAILLSVAATAQTQRQVFGRTVQSINPNNGKIRCISSEYEQSLQALYPERATEQFENWLAPKVQALENSNYRGINTVVKIPVVVHVISNGDAIGSNENISDARVISQITVLNQDFRKIINTPGYNNNPVGADMEIEFQMALRKPDGSASNGIDRVTRSLASYATEASVEALKTATGWDPAQYFNIWVVYFSDATSAEMYGVLGYAQFPSNSLLGGLDTNGGLASTDGLVIDYRCYGTSTLSPAGGSEYFTDYDKGRTATHEIGHFFGLRHIWGDNSSCSVNATDSNKDYCPDTPAAKTEHYDCAQVYNSCTAAAGNDMTANYMDYSNDTCMNIFTLNQKGRMLAVLQNSPRRGTLTTSPALEAPLASTSFAMLEGIILYPNPASDFVNISISNTVALPDSYTVYNALGQIIVAKKVANVADLSINTNELNQGIYLVKITRGSASKTLQFVKK